MACTAAVEAAHIEQVAERTELAVGRMPEQVQVAGTALVEQQQVQGQEGNHPEQEQEGNLLELAVRMTAVVEVEPRIPEVELRTPVVEAPDRMPGQVLFLEHQHPLAFLRLYRNHEP